MPATSRQQANAMRAAAHGSNSRLSKKLRASLTPEQLRDYSRFEGESHAYDHRKMNHLKQNRDR